MKSIYGAWSYAKSNTNQFGSFRVDGISLGKAAPAANSHIHDGIKALGIESGDWVSWTYAGYIAQAALEAGMSADRIVQANSISDVLGTLDSMLEPTDAVLVKASHFMGLSRVVEGLIR